MMDHRLQRKRHRVRLVQRYLLNPAMKTLAWAGVPPGHALVETRGRRTGKRRRNVVGMRVDGTTGWVVAEHGPHAGWVRNLDAEPHVSVRLGRRWRPARARVVADDAEAMLDRFERPSHARAVRRFGTDLTVVRFELEPSADTAAGGEAPPAPPDGS